MGLKSVRGRSWERLKIGSSKWVLKVWCDNWQGEGGAGSEPPRQEPSEGGGSGSEKCEGAGLKRDTEKWVVKVGLKSVRVGQWETLKSGS